MRLVIEGAWDMDLTSPQGEGNSDPLRGQACAYISKSEERIAH